MDMDKFIVEFECELDALNKQFKILKTANRMKESKKFIGLVLKIMNGRVNRLCSMLTKLTDNNSYKQ